VATEFTYSVSREGTVFIQWEGRTVVTLNGAQAEKFLRQAEGKSGQELQIVLARHTGNFKRGNERA